MPLPSYYTILYYQYAVQFEAVCTFGTATRSCTHLAPLMRSCTRLVLVRDCVYMVDTGMVQYVQYGMVPIGTANLLLLIVEVLDAVD